MKWDTNLTMFLYRSSLTNKILPHKIVMELNENSYLLINYLIVYLFILLDQIKYSVSIQPFRAKFEFTLRIDQFIENKLEISIYLLSFVYGNLAIDLVVSIDTDPHDSAVNGFVIFKSGFNSGMENIEC